MRGDGLAGVGVYREAPTKRTRLLTAILPDGRSVRLAVAPPLASRHTVRRLARLAAIAVEQEDSAARQQRRAIGRMARTVTLDTARLSTAKAERAAAIRRRLVARYKRLDARVTKAVTDFGTRVERELKIEIESVRRLGRRDLWDKIVIASSLPLFAAYGQTGQLSNTTNLALTLSLLIWLVGDDVVRTLFGSDEKSIYPWRDTDIWSYLAPIGNMLTASWLFSDRQNERFITGVTTVKADVADTAQPGQRTFRQVARVDLSPRVAADHRGDFEAFQRVSVVATIGATRLPDGAEVRGISARVRRGRLRLSFDVVTAAPVAGPADLGEVDVAWIVDTVEPAPATS